MRILIFDKNKQKLIDYKTLAKITFTPETDKPMAEFWVLEARLPCLPRVLGGFGGVNRYQNNAFRRGESASG